MTGWTGHRLTPCGDHVSLGARQWRWKSFRAKILQPWRGNLGVRRILGEA